MRKLEIVLDAEFSWLLAAYSWRLQNGYAARRLPRLDGVRRSVYMHHEITGRPEPGYEVDHINGNRLDNRRCNLRIVTKRQNHQNLAIHRAGRLPGASVMVVKRDRKTYHYWRASAWKDGTKHYLGTFKTQEAAHKAYIDFVGGLYEKEEAAGETPNSGQRPRADDALPGR